MQNDDFDKWLKRHFAAFPSLRDWVYKNPDCLDPWRDCLEDVALNDAFEATRLLNLGDEEAPKGYGDHARAVRRISRTLASSRHGDSEQTQEYIDGNPVVKCLTCKDSGIVDVANIWRTKKGCRPLTAFWAGKTNHLPICAVGCDCSATRPMRLTPLDREKMFIINLNETTDTAAERFRDWWEAGHRFGRVSAFDEYNRFGAATT